MCSEEMLGGESGETRSDSSEEGVGEGADVRGLVAALAAGLGSKGLAEVGAGSEGKTGIIGERDGVTVVL